MAWTYTQMPCVLVSRKCSIIQGISIRPGFTSATMANSEMASLVAAAMASIGQLTTKASGSMVDCPMNAGVCQVD